MGLSEKTVNRLTSLIAISPIIRRFGLPGIIGLLLAGVGFWQNIFWLKLTGLVLATPIFWAYFVLTFIYLPMLLIDALRRSRRSAK